MARDVDNLIRDAASVLSEAMDEAAAIALVAVEKYGAVLDTFCRQVANEAGMPGAFDALRMRSRRMQQGRSEDTDARTIRTQRTYLNRARTALRDPDVAREVLKDPAIQEHVARAVASSPVLARKVAEDKGARTTVSRAIDSVYEREATERKARAAESPMAGTMTKLDRERLYLRRVQALNRLRSDLRDAVEMFKGPIPEDDRAEFVQKVDQLADLISWLREHISSGKELDQELVALLEGEA